MDVKMPDKEGFADRVAELCYRRYAQLPKKGKPQEGKEWTLMAAVVLETNEGAGSQLKVVSMGTGSKCLGQSKMSVTGDVVNDSHAETIARRAFLLYLYEELQTAYLGAGSEIFTCPAPHTSHRCGLKPGIRFHFFTSHTPCGDASIFPREDHRHIPQQNQENKDAQPSEGVEKRKRDSEDLGAEAKLVKIDMEGSECVTDFSPSECVTDCSPCECVRKRKRNDDLGKKAKMVKVNMDTSKHVTGGSRSECVRQRKRNDEDLRTEAKLVKTDMDGDDCSMDCGQGEGECRPKRQDLPAFTGRILGMQTDKVEFESYSEAVTTCMLQRDSACVCDSELGTEAESCMAHNNYQAQKEKGNGNSSSNSATQSIRCFQREHPTTSYHNNVVPVKDTPSAVSLSSSENVSHRKDNSDAQSICRIGFANIHKEETQGNMENTCESEWSTDNTSTEELSTESRDFTRTDLTDACKQNNGEISSVKEWSTDTEDILRTDPADVPKQKIQNNVKNTNVKEQSTDPENICTTNAVDVCKQEIQMKNACVKEQFKMETEDVLRTVSTDVPRQEIQHSVKKNTSAREWSAEARDIHRTGAKCVPGGAQDPQEAGVHYHTLGALRIKPGRGERTLSMSCSDKMARWNIVGCQGALLSHFLSAPVFFDSVIVGKCPYSEGAMHRALFERVVSYEGGKLSSGTYKLHLPLLAQSSLQFSHSCAAMESQQQKENPNIVPSASSIIWNHGGGVEGDRHEVIVNGRRQGITKKDIHRPQARCCICNAAILARFKQLVQKVPPGDRPASLLSLCMGDTMEKTTYSQCKAAAAEYQEAWRCLRQSLLCTWLQKSADKYYQFS